VRYFDPLTLRLFVSVCEEGNIARAAEREGIVASAISKRIASIEDEIGVPLLERGSRGVHPTAAGKAMLTYALEVLELLIRMRADLGKFSNDIRGNVRLVASMSIAQTLSDDLGFFVRKFADVSVNLEERGSSDVVRSVEDGRAAVGICWDAADLGRLKTLPYCSDHLVLIVHPSNPLASRSHVAFAETMDYDHVGIAAGGTMDAFERRNAALVGKSIKFRLHVTTIDAACRIVAGNLAVGLVPIECARSFLPLGLSIVPLSDPWATRRFVICSQEHALLSPVANCLIESLLLCRSNKAC
jgi:DNA-binding transcriptional LysR family regulator